ncbi:MAG: ligase-associated DNA damage response exonuclease [Bacteroidota bacterium]|nr:ligase-associated DNA damage response exonuclease [Bacteroidota bacterium]
MASHLLQFTGKSIFCSIANVHIDPWIPVERAIITHAHSDHAKWGSQHYLAHKDSAAILKLRLGQDINLQTVEYGETFTINGVNFSLHPAGHIIGSAQVRAEYKGEVWVFTGDYKVEDDNFSAPLEIVKCHSFITEATFGLPIYKWQPQAEIFEDMYDWYSKNKSEGKTSFLMGYSLGKMQRILKNLHVNGDPLFAHGAIYYVNETLRQAGFDLPELTLVTRELDRKQFKGSLVLAPPSADNSIWSKKFAPFSSGYCSGWMLVRGAKNRRSIDQGFALSDHADWNQLLSTIKETEAERVFVTHGYTSVLSRYLNETGTWSAEVKTMYGDEEKEEEPIDETPVIEDPS